MPHGYNGKILRIDLTTGQFSVEEPDEAFYRKYMGGSALAMYYLLNEMPAGVDPLSSENILVLALSVLTGTAISGQSRMTAAAKSPLTGGIGDSQSGGFWPAELKFAGFDAIVITGKAEKPVYLWIHDGEYELRDASHLWGKITGDSEAAIQEELGDGKIEVLQVGPAGENAVRFAAIMSMSNRANGRTGLGAVMGSKNLKAVAVRGKARPTVADKAELSKFAKWGAKNLADSDVAGLAKYGTNPLTVRPCTTQSSEARRRENKIVWGGTPAMPAPYAVSAWSKSKTVSTRSIRTMEARSTKPPRPLVTTAALMIWPQFQWRINCATSTAWTPYPAGQPSPGHLKHLTRESSPLKTRMV
jgi:aldehyde:ferredoxin oxidoreductase